MPEPTPYLRASYDAVAITPRSVGSPRPPTTIGRPASSGRRSTSTAAMNSSRAMWSTHGLATASSLAERGDNGGGKRAATHGERLAPALHLQTDAGLIGGLPGSLGDVG